MTLAYIAALAAAVHAFGGGLSIAKIGAVYLAGSVIAAAAPTPGGLGPLEAALVAGLTGVGMASGRRSLPCSPTGWPPTGCRSCPVGCRWILLQRWNYV